MIPASSSAGMVVFRFHQHRNSLTMNGFGRWQYDSSCSSKVSLSSSQYSVTNGDGNFTMSVFSSLHLNWKCTVSCFEQCVYFYLFIFGDGSCRPWGVEQCDWTVCLFLIFVSFSVTFRFSGCTAGLVTQKYHPRMFNPRLPQSCPLLCLYVILIANF